MVARAWNVNINFIGHMYTILGVSAVLCILSIASLLGHGLNFGTDFAGGYEIQVRFPRPVGETEIRDFLAPLGLEDARVQRFGSESDHAYLILVRGDASTLREDQKHALKESFELLAGGPDKLSIWSVAESAESLVVGFAAPVSQEQVQDVLDKHGVDVKSIHGSDRKDKPEYSIELVSLADKIAHSLRERLKIDPHEDIIKRMDFVGPQVGAQLRNQGILAVVYSLLLILLYVAIRFDLFFSPGAVLATLHDVIITMGIFSLFGIEFNLTVVAAVLTLIGYSLNDTIVVYDRIRENLSRLRGRDLHALVNTSINETLSRTVLTSGTVLLVVMALLWLGGPFIRGFSLTMFIGVIVGTYSSIAVASPLYIVFRQYAQRRASGGKLQRGVMG